MTLAEWAVLFAVLGHSIAFIVIYTKLVAWFSTENATLKQRVVTLEYQVNNDITGRKAVSEMRSDVSAIKAQISDIKDHLTSIENKI